MVKGTAEKAKPFFVRVYKKHRTMIRQIQKEKKISSAECVRLSIEKLHEESFKKVM